MKTLNIKLWLVLFFAAIFLNACSNTLFFPKNTTYKRIKESHKLRVGMTGEQPPFNLFVSKTDTVGYDVDVAKFIAKALNAKVKISIIPFENLQNALKKHEIDMIISSFSVSKTRMKNFSFSIHYAKTAKSILTTKAKLKAIIASTGFNDKSVHLVALENSTSFDLAKKRLPHAKITTISHYEQALIMMDAGTADGLVADLPICELAIIRDTRNELTILKKPLSIEDVAIATNKNEPELQSIISNTIKKLIKTGEMDKIHNEWFNNPRWIALLP